MKKYSTPQAEKLEFSYEENVVASNTQHHGIWVLASAVAVDAIMSPDMVIRINLISNLMIQSSSDV